MDDKNVMLIGWLKFRKLFKQCQKYKSKLIKDNYDEMIQNIYKDYKLLKSYNISASPAELTQEITMNFFENTLLHINSYIKKSNEKPETVFKELHYKRSTAVINLKNAITDLNVHLQNYYKEMDKVDINCFEVKNMSNQQVTKTKSGIVLHNKVFKNIIGDNKIVLVCILSGGNCANWIMQAPGLVNSQKSVNFESLAYHISSVKISKLGFVIDTYVEIQGTLAVNFLKKFPLQNIF